ncbi:MAG: hypothetical protein ACLVAV_08760 [Clostridium sp.]
MPSPNEIEDAKEDLGSEHDPLNDHIEELKEKFDILRQVSVAVSLYDHRLLGVVSGDEEKRDQLMRILALQIAALHPYTDVRMCYVFPGRDLEKMEYTRWLPHRLTYTGQKKACMIVHCDSQSHGRWDVITWLDVTQRTVRKQGKTGKTRKKRKKSFLIM